MKKIFAIILSLLVYSGVTMAQATVGQAEQAYAQGDFKQAASIYEEVAQRDGVSSDLYYNLGNSYFKQDQLAMAILNYERALRLNPNNGNAAFNLEVARLQTTDKTVPLEKFFLSEWYESLESSFSSNAWARMAIGCFIGFILCLVLYFFVRKTLIRKIGFFAGIVLIVVCVFANIFASHQKTAMMTRNTAIVFAPSVTVKSSPAESGNELFLIHEGIKVRIKSTLGDWSEVEIADGNVGWMKSSELEII